MDQYVLPSATRRVKLRFDKNGNPAYESVKSPECFKQNALGVLPPHDVIPVIFVPGIAGSNLRVKGSKKDTWAPPNSAGGGLSAAFGSTFRSNRKRQILFDPANTEVNPDCEFSVPDNVYWLTTEEAKRRGWGGVHAGSYLDLLCRLEVSLNDQYTLPGRSVDDGNFMLPEIGLMKHLEGGPKAPPSYRISIPMPPNYETLAENAMIFWNKKAPALTVEQVKHLDSYYYPVYAYGYNWLQSNEESAKGLQKRIDEIFAHYNKSSYFKCAGKVILVTHSMGGLVARRAAQIDASKILGVVHGVQPVMGAPVLYRRMRAGQEGSGVEGTVVSVIMGSSEAEMTAQLARAPGPFELAPTKHYPMNWLRCRLDNEKKEVLFTLPKSDPYTEIYAKTTDDCWWGMVNPEYIDPAGTIRRNNKNPAKEYKNAVDIAKVFHDKLGLYAHPETYGFYGIDNNKHRSFGHVEWIIPEGVRKFTDSIDEIKNAKVAEDPLGGVPSYTSGKVRLRFVSKQKTKAAGMEYHDQKLFNAVLSDQCNQRGDATVPEDSGKVLERLNPPPKEAFAMAGFDHQTAYNDPFAYQAAIYFIARLVQNAPPPTPFC
ncbi:MAG: hypothetical protein FWG52_01760 [Proteobacteria bacterium]|nr:hypothetical protein [Pseudomonadota bacterium]